MATASTFTTLGALHDLPSNDDVLDRLKTLAKSILPEGWEDWTLINSIDLDFAVDPSVLNKLRFVLPYEGIARAFDPSSSSLKEHRLREMKVKMLSWAFCRGLIFSPSSLSKQIRGTSSSHDSFMSATAKIRSSLPSREAADRLLAGSPRSTTSSRRASTSGDSLARLESFEARFEAQEARTERVENTLEKILSELQKRNPSSALDSSPSPSSDSQSSETEDWEPPSMFSDTEPEFSFGPSTKEMEPSVPLPAPELEALGIECQRLNSGSWAKIPFLEAQKDIHASGVFSRLKVNPEMEGRLSAKDDILAKMEGSLGILTHGLLLQRKLLEESMKTIILQHPTVAPALREHLSAKESMFRKKTDSLLQFVCGKRSDVIVQRRKALESNTHVHPRFLKDIPPSGGFLFDPKQLAEVIKNHASSSGSRVIKGSRPPAKSLATAPRAAPTSSASRKRPAQWKAPHQPEKKRSFRTKQHSGTGRSKSSGKAHRRY
ncbi:hypothetical protein WDU94_005581 [Cyamophila willieti]